MTGPDHSDGSRDRGAGADNLVLRIGSAVVLAPLALAITYAGGWLFIALCALAAAGIAWEWASVISHRADPHIVAPAWVALAAAAVLAGLRLPELALVAVAVGAVSAFLAVWAAGRGASPIWAGTGVIYAGIALLPPVLLRGDRQWGLTALLFLFANVWITDIFAYFSGRTLRGPLLWPRVSPKKTWSGAVGGLAGGVAAGVLVAYASGVGRLGIIGVMALLLSILAQAGDLLESAVKRRFDVKDASHLIPGHGGLMDRLDGFLVAALAALLIGLFRDGIAAPARGLLIW